MTTLDHPQAAARQTLAAQRSRQLLDAAARLMEREGSEAVTMQALAAEAGVSVGLIYRYFGGKDEILLAVITQVLDAFASEVPAAIEQAGEDPVRRLAAAFGAYCRVIDEYRHAAVLTYRESKSLDAAGRDPGPLRVGLATRARNGVDLDPSVERAVLDAAKLCEELGHRVEEMVPAFDPADVGATSGTLMGADLVVTIDDRLAQLGRELQPGDVEPFTELLLGHYRSLTGVDVHRALRHAQEIGWEVGTAFDTYDVLLTPTLACEVPPLGLLDTTNPAAMYEHGSTYSSWTSVFNVTGMPAISLPLATAGDGMPIGVQFVADLGYEARLISLAAQLEQAAPWQLLAP